VVVFGKRQSAKQDSHTSNNAPTRKALEYPTYGNGIYAPSPLRNTTRTCINVHDLSICCGHCDSIKS
jgi:hypothetical protein